MMGKTLKTLQSVFPEPTTGTRKVTPHLAERVPVATITWKEEYEGGSAEAERVVFAQLAQDIMRVQLKTKQRAKASAVARTFHAKAVLSLRRATLRFHDALPAAYRVGFARPGAAYDTIVRFSNAASAPQASSTSSTPSLS